MDRSGDIAIRLESSADDGAAAQARERRRTDVDPAETSLLIVAHGTDLNENSAVAAKREAEKIRALGKYAAVLNVYMEEPPLVSDWRKLTETPNVVVVPFFISDGFHSYKDIPCCLGLPMVILSEAERSRRIPRSFLGFLTGSLDFARDDVRTTKRSVFRTKPYKIDSRLLFYAPSIGTDPGFADIIIEQALTLQKVEIVLALGFLCARLLPRE